MLRGRKTHAIIGILGLSVGLLGGWVGGTAGCSGTVGGADDASPDTKADGLVLLEVGPTDAGADGQVCTPDEVFCASPKERARCKANGQGWTSIGFCDGLKRCDPETVLCKLVVCAPGAAVCVGGERGECNAAGTGLVPGGAMEACPPDTTCVTGKGCVPWICTPGHTACAESGGVGTCGKDGLSVLATAPGCQASECASCLDGPLELVCPNPATDALILPGACGADGQCVPGLGCLPGACSPGEARCGASNAWAECAADGVTWLPKPCGAYERCVQDGDGPPTCQFDCGPSTGCARLNACTPLPPQGHEPWTPPADPTTLLVTFEVGIEDALDTAFVNVAPVRNLVTGAFVDALAAWSPGEPEPAGGWIRVTEDGQHVPATCVPLPNSTHATADIVFVVDVTGSMQDEIDHVRDSTQQLATFLSGAGLNVQFAVVPFTDHAPAEHFQPLALTADLTKVTQYLGNLLASGGWEAPENALDALVHAMDTLQWRPGAQKVMLLITDAPAHDVGDGSSEAAVKHSLLTTIGKLYRHAVVHSVSPGWPEPMLMGSYPNARLVSCATGGTAVQLEAFLDQQIQKALFAEALAKSFHCTFVSSDPAFPHDVTVEVRVPHGGAVLEGASHVPGVTYW